MTTSRATEVGRAIGEAMARDAKAEDMPREWTGIDPQDGDRATAAGIVPDTDEWDEMERSAREAYEAASEGRDR
jgi:hypothetical protein